MSQEEEYQACEGQLEVQFEGPTYHDTKQKQQKLKTWVIFCKKRGKKSEEQIQYYDQMEVVGSFSTIKTFFDFYSLIQEPSALAQDTKIFFFLENCRPIWEQWEESGELLIQIKFKDESKNETAGKILNRTWQYLLFSLIGNNLPNKKGRQVQVKEKGKEQIIGLILQRRQGITLIEVWFRTKQDMALSGQILKDLKDHLKLSFTQQKVNSTIVSREAKHKQSKKAKSTLKSGNKINSAKKLPQIK